MVPGWNEPGPFRIVDGAGGSAYKAKMGWRDRDWAQLAERERRSLYGGTRRRAGSAWAIGSGTVLLAAAASLAVYAVGHYPRGKPLVPVLAFHLPTLHPHPVAHIATTAATYGTTFTLRGSTSLSTSGVVSVEGSWNGAPWQPLASTVLSGGSYDVSFPITQHGTLKLRATYPGGEADGTVLVP